MDFTMLRQICRRGRLAGLTNIHNNTDSLFNKASRLLFADPAKVSGASNLDNQSDVQAAEFNSKGSTLPLDLYELILQHINAIDGPNTFRHRNALPHPLDAHVLPPLALPVSRIEHKGHGYSTFTSHPANSSISFFNGTLNTFDAGFIVSMWCQVLMGQTRTFIVVAPHTPLSDYDRTQSPYVTRPGFQATLVYSEPTPVLECRHVVLETPQIHSHIAFRDRPAGTFGIEQPTRILLDSLHRNR